MTALNLDHFLKVHEMLASYYGTQAPTLPGVTLAYQSLMSECPELTSAQFDYAVKKAVAHCRFHPRVHDFMSELFEPDLSAGPSMPDIDPRYADSYQLNTYYAAKARLDKYAETAPLNPKSFRLDRAHEIPELPHNPVTLLSENSGGRAEQRLMDSGESRQALPRLDLEYTSGPSFLP
jgi:hypothetical protein